MLNHDEVSAECRQLLMGNRVTFTKGSKNPGPPPDSWIQDQVRGRTYLRTSLKFSGPVNVSGVSLHADSVHYLAGSSVFLSWDNDAASVQLARASWDPSIRKYDCRNFKFLSPVGLESREEFTMHICGESEKADFTRLELLYFGVESSDEVQSDTDSMVTFQFDGQSVQANKFMLAARSEVFKGQFFGNCKESTTGVVSIQDFSFQAFRCFLSLLEDYSSDGAYHVIHSASAGVDLVEVYAIADKYCTPKARNILKAAVLQSVSEDNVRDLLTRCKKYQATPLVAGICEKIVARFPKEHVTTLLTEILTESLTD